MKYCQISVGQIPTMEEMVSALFEADNEHRIQAFNILTGVNENYNKSKDELLTKKEACKILNCSPAKIDRLVKAGKLNKIQTFGKHSKNYFKLSEIQALIESSRIPNPATREAIV